MLRSFFYLLILSIGTSLSSAAQSSENMLMEDYFGVDQKNKIIVCHRSLVDSISMPTIAASDFNLGSTTYSFINSEKELKTSSTYIVANLTDTFQLYVTPLPIIKITAPDTIVNEPKSIAQLTYADSTANYRSTIGIELRGNSALKYPKKSYDIEIRKDSLTEVSSDLQFGTLRKDDDWLLNSLYNEPLKLRTIFSTKLWLDVHSPSYSNEEPKAKSSNDLIFAEVFLNEAYVGIYMLSEQVDRKQLKLGKMKNDTVYGELFKANSYLDATTFKNAPTFNNALPTWSGFQMKYPYENYNAHWEGLYQFVSLVTTEDDEEFENEIADRLDLDNAIDYFIFVNLLRATDNLGKNYYVAKYTQDTPYFFVPWDLDGVLGCIQDAKRIETTDDIVSNALFDRLLAVNPSNYRSRLKTRWTSLRADVYSNENLLKRLDAIYTLLNDLQIYERDGLVWPRIGKAELDYDYLKKWLKHRLEFLDMLYASFD